MRKILSILKQDLTLSLRDNIMIYLFIAPLFLALVAKAFLPTVEDSWLTFAVHQNIGEEIIEELKGYGNVEIFNTKEAVIQRVEKLDIVAGLALDDNKIQLIFEGNEPPEIIETYKGITSKVFRESSFVTVNEISLDLKESILFNLVTAILIMTAIFLSGTVSAFNLIDEKDSNVIRALAVSPTTLYKMLIARGIFSIITALLIALVTSYIMAGPGIPYLNLFLTVIASSFLIIMVTVLIGGFANNQITAIAVIKIVMPLYLTVPIVSLFVSDKLQPIFYIFPNYWQLQMLKSIYPLTGITFNYWFSGAILIILSGIFTMVLAKVLKPKLQLR